jgi:hypothetical protein
MNEQQPQAMMTNQVLVAALMTGMVMFAAVAAGLVVTGTFEPDMTEMAGLLLGLVGALWLGSAAGAYFAGAAAVQKARRQWSAGRGDDAWELLPRYSSLLILRAGLLEGPGLFGIVGFLLTGQWLGLAAAGLSLIGMLAIFPTADRFLAFASRVAERPIV